MPETPERRRRRVRLVCALLLTISWTGQPAPASAATVTDVTSEIRTGQNITLDGDSIVRLPAGTTTYGGVISGVGTLTISGTGTLVLTADSTFALPTDRRTESVSTTSTAADYAINTVRDANPPAVIIDTGATLQLGTPTSAGGSISASQFDTPGSGVNIDNIQDDGTLVLDNNHNMNIGVLSGSGVLRQPRNLSGYKYMIGSNPFTGSLVIGSGANFGTNHMPFSISSARSLFNDGSLIIAAPDQHTLTVPQNIYTDHVGDDVNFGPYSQGLIVMDGIYEYSDSGNEAAPSLGNPVDNYNAMPQYGSHRGVNIEGSDVQWGNGTSSAMFLPGSSQTAYINLHDGALAFDYDGPTTLNVPISGGSIQSPLSAAGTGTVTVMATSGNAVAFTTPEDYHGTTTIGAGASLQLGGSSVGGDSSLLTGTSADTVVDDGTLIVNNSSIASILPPVSGTGTLVQSGAAKTTLTRATYTGSTTIKAGALALTGTATLTDSSGVALTGGHATLDLTHAANQSLRSLSGVTGTTVALGATTLTVGVDAGRTATFAGAITGTSGKLVKVGPGALTLTGTSTTPAGTWQLTQGTLALAGATVTAGGFTQSPGTTLELTPSGSSPVLTVAGPVHLAGTLQVTPPSSAKPGQKYTVLHQTSAQSITGTFNSLAEGAHITAGGITFQISYVGGADGHDVVLTTLASTASPRAASSARADAAPGSARATVATTDAGAGLEEKLILAASCAVAAAILLLVLLRRRRTDATAAGPARGSHARHRPTLDHPQYLGEDDRDTMTLPKIDQGRAKH